MSAANVADLPLDLDTEPDVLAAALALAARNIPVFPIWPINDDGTCACPKGASCKDTGKHPLSPLVPNGLHGASTDPRTITEWWILFADANLAAVTGPASRILVLDIDAKAGGWDSISDLEAQYGELKPTWAVETGGGGLHAYFAYPPDATIRNSAGKLAPGLDIRGDGGFVICPPSLHHSGNRYAWGAAWHPDRVPLADPPPWLLNRLAEPSTIQKRAPSLADGEPIKDGGRNDTLTSWGGTMRRRGFCEESILAALRIVNAKRCTPPLDDVEVAKISHSVARYAPAELSVLSQSPRPFAREGKFRRLQPSVDFIGGKVVSR